jgi:excisionase family DNA binding protein
MSVIDNYLNTVKAAEVLGFHIMTVERMCREGRIPAKKSHKNIWSINKSELEKYLADRRLKTERTQVYGQQLKTARNQLGLSQPELAVIFGVSSAAISRWEHGNRSPRGEHSQQILRWLQQQGQ